jgi:hypothetical protein
MLRPQQSAVNGCRLCENSAEARQRYSRISPRCWAQRSVTEGSFGCQQYLRTASSHRSRSGGGKYFRVSGADVYPTAPTIFRWLGPRSFHGRNVPQCPCKTGWGIREMNFLCLNSQITASASSNHPPSRTFAAKRSSQPAQLDSEARRRPSQTLPTEYLLYRCLCHRPTR